MELINKDTPQVKEFISHHYRCSVEPGGRVEPLMYLDKVFVHVWQFI
jgi:hypothetical protein